MIEMLHIDCMEYMATLPDKAFELAIVDPPYGIDRNGMEMGNSVFNKDKKVWDKLIPNKEYFTELFRVSKNQIIWGGNYFELPVSRYFAIWDKGETMYGRDFAECEYAWVRSGKNLRIFKYYSAKVEPKGKIHPTQKPIALYKWLLHNYAKPGDRILDTHGGSRSLAIACHQMGFDHVSCELDKDYHDASVKRFKEQTAQLAIFK